MLRRLLVTGEPPCQKKYGRDFRDFGWLKTHRPKSDPPPRTVDAHSDMRDVTTGQRDQCNAQPNPPRALPKMIINQRRCNAHDQPDAQPDGLSLEEKQSVAVTV